MALEVGVALLLVTAIALPHLMPLHRVAPVSAACVWLAALVLRALVALGGALFIFVYLPGTGLYRALAEWCLHEVLPLLATHLGFSGHPVAHAAVLLPALVLAISLLWLLVGLVRGWFALRRKLGSAIGAGPLGSTVVRDGRVLVAVTGLGRGKIVVSEAALQAMDREELQASLAHELGHMRRRHRPLLLLASLLAALARVVPGTRAAEHELSFHLERDADEYAVARTHDPLALASAICKAATASIAGATGLGGRGRVSLRLEYLVDGRERRGGARLEAAARLLAVAIGTLALTLAVSLPAWAVTSPSSVSAPVLAADCPHAH